MKKSIKTLRMHSKLKASLKIWKSLSLDTPSFGIKANGKFSWMNLQRNSIIKKSKVSILLHNTSLLSLTHHTWTFYSCLMKLILWKNGYLESQNLKSWIKRVLWNSLLTRGSILHGLSKKEKFSSTLLDGRFPKKRLLHSLLIQLLLMNGLDKKSTEIRIKSKWAFNKASDILSQ